MNAQPYNRYNPQTLRKSTMPRVTITDSKLVPFTGNIDNYMTVGGYTRNSGAPTDYKVQVQGSDKWYRVYVYIASNSGTSFIKTKQSSFSVIDNVWDIK